MATNSGFSLNTAVRPPEPPAVGSPENKRPGLKDELRELRERFRALYQQDLFSVFTADLQGNFLDANDAALRLLGYSREDIPQLNYGALIADEQDLGKAMEVLGEIACTVAQRDHRTYRLRRKDGSLVWVETEASLLYRQGRPYAVQGIARDVTGQKQAEEVLRQGEERFRELARLLPEIVFEMDMMGVLTFVNEKATESTGYTLEDFERGLQALWLVAPEDRDRAAGNILTLLQGAEVGSSEYTLCRRDGSRFPVMIRTTPILKAGRVVGLRGIVFDITAQKRLEDDLRRHGEQLQEMVEARTAELKRANTQLLQEIGERKEAEREIRLLNEKLEERVKQRTAELEKAYGELKRLDGMKDAFLSLVSHELRTPLTSISSFSEILLSYEEEDPRTRREFLEIIHTETERLTRLINDVLDLSKIEAGRMVYRDDPLPIHEVIQDVARLEAPLLGKGSLRLALDLCSEPLQALADRDRIQQVVTNLLGNAIKFSSPGGQIRISTESFPGKRAGEASEWVKVSVSDQGDGIEERDFALIFEKFSQGSVDTLKDKPRGTGLGLPICKEIVSHYRGNLWVESEKGKGSTFSFTLPRAGVRLPEGSETSPMSRDGKDQQRTILVVDDNPNIRRLLRYHFENRGYRVLEAEDGIQAVDQAQRATVDLITLDLIMPMMNGYDVLGILREDPRMRRIPILVLSMMEDRERGLQLGANDFLAKPFREEDLIGKVRSLLGHENRTVLLVDDNRAVLEMLRARLEDMGYQVSVALDGDEALERIKESLPGLVILDLIMPRMNGLEVLNWIRSRDETRRLPVIILSSYQIPDEQGRIISQQADAFVEKRDDLNTLFKQVEAILGCPVP